MSEAADTKARRRKRIKESFPAPLNEIALRHVDTVQALSTDQKEILAKALQKMGIHYLVDCLGIMKRQTIEIQDEDALITLLKLTDQPQLEVIAEVSDQFECTSEDQDYLAGLLIKCYLDMPRSSAQALVASDVMSASLHVVLATRHALADAKSDFVITALYTLFEERLNAIKQVINRNPAFVKAIQRSRPDWNTKN